MGCIPTGVSNCNRTTNFYTFWTLGCGIAGEIDCQIYKSMPVEPPPRALSLNPAGSPSAECRRPSSPLPTAFGSAPVIGIRLLTHQHVIPYRVRLEVKSKTFKAKTKNFEHEVKAKDMIGFMNNFQRLLALNVGFRFHTCHSFLWSSLFGACHIKDVVDKFHSPWRSVARDMFLRKFHQPLPISVSK